MRAEVKLHSTSSTAHTKIREDADDVRRMMLILISEAISNSNAVIRREFGKLRFQMIDDNPGAHPLAVGRQGTHHRILPGFLHRPRRALIPAPAGIAPATTAEQKENKKNDQNSFHMDPPP